MFVGGGDCRSGGFGGCCVREQASVSGWNFSFICCPRREELSERRILRSISLDCVVAGGGALVFGSCWRVWRSC